MNRSTEQCVICGIETEGLGNDRQWFGAKCFCTNCYVGGIEWAAKSAARERQRLRIAILEASRGLPEATPELVAALTRLLEK